MIELIFLFCKKGSKKVNYVFPVELAWMPATLPPRQPTTNGVSPAIVGTPTK